MRVSVLVEITCGLKLASAEVVAERTLRAVSRGTPTQRGREGKPDSRRYAIKGSISVLSAEPVWPFAEGSRLLPS